MDNASTECIHTTKPRIGKKLRKLLMKNAKKSGKSARRGNRPSPYTKYKKRAYQYSFKSRRVDNYDTARAA